MRYTTLSLFLLLVIAPLGISAQKYTIYADDFSSEVEVPNKVISTIRSAFIGGIDKTNRVKVVDAITSDPDLSLTPLEDARRVGADYLLMGKLLNREATDDGSSNIRYHSRANSYKEKFTLRLNLIRTSDGTTISTRDYEETGSAQGKETTQYSALCNALINVPYEMNIYVENYFKVYGSILREVTVKRGKSKTVYVNLGYNAPIKEGVRLNVIESKVVAGKNMEQKIGEVRIDEIVGPQISLCKVNKGGEEIHRALDEGKTLRLVSRQAKLFDEYKYDNK